MNKLMAIRALENAIKSMECLKKEKMSNITKFVIDVNITKTKQLIQKLKEI